MKATIALENDKPILVLQSESPQEDYIFACMDLLDNYVMRFARFAGTGVIDDRNRITRTRRWSKE